MRKPLEEGEKGPTLIKRCPGNCCINARYEKKKNGINAVHVFSLAYHTDLPGSRNGRDSIDLHDTGLPEGNKKSEKGETRKGNKGNSTTLEKGLVKASKERKGKRDP